MVLPGCDRGSNRLGCSMENKEVVSVLHGLVQTLEDGKEGFKLAADAAENGDMRILFLHYSRQREQFAAELLHLSEMYGDDSETQEGSLVGAIHRGWLNLRNVINAKDPASIL